ncbi:MAG TPA: allophanate hydrolase [Rhizomicrobium sp.]
MAISFVLENLADGYRAGHFTPADVAREALARIAAYDDPAVWIARVPEAAVLTRAQSLTDKNLPLYGIPFAVKDNIDCAGLPTTAGCPAFAYRPHADASVVARLQAAGAILLGKTNLDQFATGLVGTRSPYGAPRCVFNRDYVSGGSSSGSAVAVAAGLASFALGTDTAGSGRVPAAYNNIVGLKSSKGLVSTHGVVPACRSLDCVSVFAHTVPGAQAVLEVAQGFDAQDPYSRAAEPLPLPHRLRIGILPAKDYAGDNDALYQAAIQTLPVQGHTVVEIDYAPFAAAAALLYEGAWAAERLAAIESFLTHHEADAEPSVRSVIIGARKLTAVDAFRGQYRLAEACRAAQSQWSRMDVLLLPTAPRQDTVAAVMADPIARNAALGRYTNFVNLMDLAAIAVPAGFRTDGLAFGVTFIAPAFTDTALAALAGQFHRSRALGLGADRNASYPMEKP